MQAATRFSRIVPVRFLLPLLLLMLHFEATLSRAEDALTLEQVIESTLVRHPALSAIQQHIRQAEGELLSAQGAFDPKLKSATQNYFEGGYSGSYYDIYVEQPTPYLGSRFFGGYRKGAGSFPVYEDWYGTNDGGETSIGVELPLLRGRTTDPARTKLEQSLQSQRIAGADVRREQIFLVREAAHAYWGWVAAGRKNKIFSGLEKVAEHRGSQLKHRFESGDIPEFDVTDNQRALYKRQSQRIKSEEEYQKSKLKLSLFLLDELGEPSNIDDKVLPAALPPPALHPEIDEDAYVEAAMKIRPEIIATEAKLRNAEADVRLSENQLLPQVNAKVLTADDHGSGGSSKSEREVKGGLSIEIPLRMRKQYGELDAARARARELESVLKAYQQKLDRDVRQAAVALRMSARRIVTESQELQASEELEAGERVRFEQGDSNLIFVNLREQTTADAAVNLTNALLEYHQAKADFAAATGVIPKGETPELKRPL